MTVHDGVSFFRMHKENSLIAVILEDFTVSVIDFETRRVVRKFTGHSGQITDAAFSPDARWLVTSSMDSTIRTWDLPTGALVDWIKVRFYFFFN
jgi:U3 small nucleolar RNA-associated protein 21